MISFENQNIEFKQEYVSDIRKEVIGFANADGGVVYVGIRKDGVVIGMEDPDSAMLQIVNSLKDSIAPDIMPFVKVQAEQMEGKHVVEIHVTTGTNRPYYLREKGLKPSGVYVRKGSSTQPMTEEGIREMIIENSGRSFESCRSMNQELTFKEFTAQMEARSIAIGSAQMKTLKLIGEDGLYTNLALLLSDQCVHTIKAAVFEGTIQNEFKDRREFSGSLFCQMNEAYDYIDFRNQNHSTFSKLRRIDRRDYPEEAVREALLNLLVHREYSFRASSFISIYADRIEFTSIGGLISGMTLQDVMMGISVCRNAKLANVFYRLELIEAYGTGIRKIMEAYEGSARKPKIEVTENAFKITIPNRNISNASDEETEDQKESVEQEKRVMKLAKERGFVSRKEIERLLGISQSTGGRLLKKMVAAGQIVQIGKGKNTHYVLQN